MENSNELSQLHPKKFIEIRLLQNILRHEKYLTQLLRCNEIDDQVIESDKK